MDDLARLAALEQIRTLKAQYWRGVDTQDAKMLRSVFTDDAEIDFRADMPDPELSATQPLPDPDQFVSITMASLHGAVSIHHGHTPDIAFTSGETATGFWPMEDHIWKVSENCKLPFKHLRGFGFYHDRYVKTPQGWKIAATTLKRVHVDIE